MLFAHSDRPCVNSTPIFSRQQCWIQHILPSWEKRRSRKLLFTCYILTSSDCCSTIHSLNCTSVFIHFCSLRLLSFSILKFLHDFNTSFHLLWTIYLKLINILKALSFCGNFDLYLLPVYTTKPLSWTKLYNVYLKLLQTPLLFGASLRTLSIMQIIITHLPATSWGNELFWSLQNQINLCMFHFPVLNNIGWTSWKMWYYEGWQKPIKIQIIAVKQCLEFN